LELRIPKVREGSFFRGCSSRGFPLPLPMRQRETEALAPRGQDAIDRRRPQGSTLTWNEEADGLTVPVVAMPARDLHRRLKPFAADYDHVVIDTPPGHPAIVAGALQAADVAIVPVAPRGHSF
jgi:Mrp family chromosome partitioning ATPase